MRCRSLRPLYKADKPRNLAMSLSESNPKWDREESESIAKVLVGGASCVQTRPKSFLLSCHVQKLGEGHVLIYLMGSEDSN